MEGDPATGTLAPLRANLAGDDRPLRLVFLHGVGDHCPGYAIGDGGWLSPKRAEELGLVAGDFVPPKSITVDVFMGGTPEPASYVQYARRTYRSIGTRLPSDLQIEAIEITWSPLTRWLKTTQLAYDSPSAFDSPKDEACREPPDAERIPPVKHPPARAALNQMIKEEMLDRNLADAIIYAGTYGPVLERGVAEALCHAITGPAPTTRCAWPAPDTDRYRYVFVTHSLGSRILYDTLLHLVGVATSEKGNPFAKGRFEADDAWRRSQPYVAQMLARTPAIYMMANQLSLMGLSRASPDATPTSGPGPLLLPKAMEGPASCATITTALAQARDDAIRSLNEPVTALRLVAFNDTNDLLTWHVPRWYESDSADRCRPNVEVTNVFVQNAANWLLIESPLPAHRNYFGNRQVWNAITCGGVSGRVADYCP
jgi:hypothetical protein